MKQLNGKTIFGLLLAGAGTLFGWLGSQVMAQEHDEEFEKSLSEKYYLIPRKKDEEES